MDAGVGAVGSLLDLVVGFEVPEYDGGPGALGWRVRDHDRVAEVGPLVVGADVGEVDEGLRVSTGYLESRFVARLKTGRFQPTWDF